MAPGPRCDYALLSEQDSEALLPDEQHSSSCTLSDPLEDCPTPQSTLSTKVLLSPTSPRSLFLSVWMLLARVSRDRLLSSEDENEDDRTRSLPSIEQEFITLNVGAAVSTALSLSDRMRIVLLVPGCLLLSVLVIALFARSALPAAPTAASTLLMAAASAKATFSASTATTGTTSTTALFLFLDTVFPLHASLLAEQCWDASSAVPFSIDGVDEKHAAASGAMVLQEHEEAIPSREQLSALMQQRDSFPLSLTQRVHRHMHAYFLHYRQTYDENNISQSQFHASGYQPLTDGGQLREARVRVLAPSLLSHAELRPIALSYSHQQQSPAADEQVAANNLSVITWPVGVHLVFYVLLSDPVRELNESNGGIRNCLGGYPIAVYLAGPTMKKRPLIRDMYHGLYQVVASSQLTVGLHWLSIETTNHSHATFAINFTDDQPLLRVVSSLDTRWLTLPVHPLIGQHLPASATLSLPTSRDHCTEEHFEIESEWSGEWIRLGQPANTSVSSAVEAAEPSRCPVVPHSERLVPLHGEPVLPVCSGVFPSNSTSPTSFTQPWVYTRSSCVFHQYSVGETLTCLDNSWLLVIGDSNMQDWKRNLLGLLLGARHLWRIEQGRTTDDVWTLQPAPTLQAGSTPPRPSHVRITQVFDGHHDETNNGEGMHSFRFASMQSRLRGLFNGSAAASVNVSGAELPPVPSHVIFMSGLHDAFSARQLDRMGSWVHDLPAERMVHTVDEPVVPLFDSRRLVNTSELEAHTVSTELIGLPISSFRLQVRRVVQLFDELSQLHPLTSRTQFMWRTTVSPLTAVVSLSFDMANIWTVRQFNAVVISELRRNSLRPYNASQPAVRWRLNDQYDLTYPWSNTALGLYSDGGHYGRKPPPCESGWCVDNPFVEIMQVHVSVNMMCNDRRSQGSNVVDL